MAKAETETQSSTEPKNRYWNAKRNPDYTIDQDWASYTPEEHNRWDRLYARCETILKNRACNDYIKALGQLQLSESGVPDMERLSDRLENISGWRIVPVTDLVPDDIFFDHLANKRFPAGAFIRPESEMDYLQEPDIFHDIFGHVPLLAHAPYANFIESYGKEGRRALDRGMLKNLARLYWYTVEFGLVKSPEGLRIFGAGIMSSAAESVFALEDKSSHRIAFDLERVMSTNYIISDFQKTYFVIESFEDLLDAFYQDFDGIYSRLGNAQTIEPHEITSQDAILTKGTLEYFTK